MFFFQAEDGIRDVERSRGLGDVYKRQHNQHSCITCTKQPRLEIRGVGDAWQSEATKDEREVKSSIPWRPNLFDDVIKHCCPKGSIMSAISTIKPLATPPVPKAQMVRAFDDEITTPGKLGPQPRGGNTAVPAFLHMKHTTKGSRSGQLKK